MPLNSNHEEGDEILDAQIGPHKRTYAQTAAYVDQVRKTERWPDLCDRIRQFHEARGTRVESRKDAIALVIMQATLVVMAEFVDGEGWVPEPWLMKYVIAPEDDGGDAA
jgi:hypothetical protein